MARTPAQVTTLLRGLTARLRGVLGKNLVGFYLSGSITQGAFDPRRSDIDCVAVTRRDLSDTQLRRLRDWLDASARVNPWTSRLQLQFLQKHQILTMNARACLYQFGVLQRTGSDGNPIIWMNILTTGRILHGPRPRSFVPEITREMLFEALRRELGYLREEITDKPASEWRNVPKYQAFAVMTVCRILYSSTKGTVVSKPVAARWAIRNLPKRWHPVIRQAGSFDRGERTSGISLTRIREFLEYAAGRLGDGPGLG
ncbi:MAG TPA: aminoglycoside adenylyltransferase domain-containing protein [Gemmatimonadales bacterium]|nr:aminoglycoside adenylyltransferase domain-containing protein [Gemmatimonadales bacterium]